MQGGASRRVKQQDKITKSHADADATGKTKPTKDKERAKQAQHMQHPIKYKCQRELRGPMKEAEREMPGMCPMM